MLWKIISDRSVTQIFTADAIENPVSLSLTLSLAFIPVMAKVYRGRSDEVVEVNSKQYSNVGLHGSQVPAGFASAFDPFPPVGVKIDIN